jgi:hypothetical protein
MWAWMHAAELHHQQTQMLLPAFGAFHAVVAAAADAASAAATDAAITQLLQLIQQQATNTDVSSQPHKHLQLSAQQLAGATVPPGQLLQLLHASCKLEQIPSTLLQLLTHSAVQALPQLAPIQVADVLASLATCHSSCSPHTKQLPKRAALNKALSKYLQQNQHAFDAASTVALATALARDSYISSSASSKSSSSSSSSFTLLSMLMMDHMQHMSSRQMSNVLAACAVAQHYNQAVVDAAVQLAVQLLRQQGFRLQQQQQQQHEADEAGDTQQQALAEETRSQQQQQQQRSGSITAADEEASPKQAADQSIPQQQQRDGFSPESLAQLLQACSALRHHSAELLECAATATLRSLHAMQLQQVVEVVAACAQLNHYNLALFQEACRLAQHAMAEDLAQQQQQQQQQQASTGRRPATGSSSSSSCSILASTVTQLAASCAVVHHYEKAFFEVLAGWLGQLQVQQLSQQQLLQWFQVRCGVLVCRLCTALFGVPASAVLHAAGCCCSCLDIVDAIYAVQG